MFKIKTQTEKNESLYDQWAEIFTVEHVCSPLSSIKICDEKDAIGDVGDSYPIIVTRRDENGDEWAFAEVNKDTVLDAEIKFGIPEAFSTPASKLLSPLQYEKYVSADKPFMEAMREMINLEKPYYFVIKEGEIIGIFSPNDFFHSNFQMMLFRFFIELEELAGYILKRSPEIVLKNISNNLQGKVERMYQTHRGRNPNIPTPIGVFVSGVQALFHDELPFKRDQQRLKRMDYFSFSEKIWAMRNCVHVHDHIKCLKEKRFTDLITKLRNALAHGETYILRDSFQEVTTISDFLFWLTNLRDEMRNFLHAGYLWDGSRLKAYRQNSDEWITDFQWPFELSEIFPKPIEPLITQF